MKKTISILALVVLVAAVSVLGTMAYLTSTDTVTNTFTVGKVKIKLDEAKVNADGKPVDNQGQEVTGLASAKRVKENSYKLMPGHSYTKDPTVTVLKGSDASYVRLRVIVTFNTALNNMQLQAKIDNIFTGYNPNWKRVKKVDDVNEEANITTIYYEYRYNTTVSALENDVVLPALFTGISIPGSVEAEELAIISGMEIKIVAQAIQADGFNTADAAWSTVDVQ